MTKDEKIKYLINLKFGSVKNFSDKIGLPYTTVDSILKRGILKSNVLNALKICKFLDIDINDLKDFDDKNFLSNISNDKVSREQFMKEVFAMMDRTDIGHNEKVLITQIITFVCEHT